MTNTKSTFLSYLEEFDGTGGGVAGAFTPHVLQHTQLTQNPNEDDEDKETEYERRMTKELQDALSGDTNQDDSKVIDPAGRLTPDQRILRHLKNLLYKEPGYASVELDDEPSGEFPSDNDHEVFNGDRQLMSNGAPVVNSSYGQMDDPNNPRKYADTSYNPADRALQDDKHAQLVAAIKDLRDELRHSRGQAVNVEQEEETEEDQADDTTQFANAGKMFQTLINQKMSRAKIIASFEKNLGVTNSTATSYYQRLAKQAGLTNSGDREMPGQPPGLGQAGGFDQETTTGAGAMGAALPPEESNVSGVQVANDPNRQGLIRQVKGAHLVYKRQNEEGTFDELWVFGTGNEMEDALQVRRNILAGTDIPPRATKSADGSQSYTLKTLGNGQILNIKGLPN